MVVTISDIGPIIIGVALIALVGIILYAAIAKYDADSVLKILGALGTLIGFIVGGMGAYFFTRGQVAEKESLYTAVRSELKATESEKVRLRRRRH